jgi:uncharacterized OsmC-like protein
MTADTTADTKIRDALARVETAFSKKPGLARSTDKTLARVEAGLKCVTRQGDYTSMIDMPAAMGGDGSAPSPGFLGRSAIAGCLAIGIKMTAARAGVPVEAVEVEIEMDWDDRGLLGMGEAPAGCLGSRLRIAVDSPAPEEAVRAMVDDAMANSPWLSTFIEPQNVVTDSRTGAASMAED